MNCPNERKSRTEFDPGRRDFLKKTPLAAGLVGTLLAAGGSEVAAAGQSRSTVIDERDPANIKVARRVSADLGEDDILFLRQIGVHAVLASFNPARVTLDEMRQAQARFARHQVKIYSGVHPAYRSQRIQLGQPGRDEDIETYQNFLRNLGRLGIPVTGYDFHPGNTYTTAMVKQRGYRVREFSLEDFRNKVERPRFDRPYSAEEIWDNYTYFMKAVLPVAEEANVKMALHPDDPPVAVMNGVAKVFTHYDGYRRAEEIAGSSGHWGLTFCVGTWSEGGERMGKDVFEMIRDFGRRGKIHVIHFRNVSSPLPRFRETLPDDGYQDMYRVMKTLRQVGFNGALVPDHIPGLVNDQGQRAGAAYCIAYIRALLRRANKEVG